MIYWIKGSPNLWNLALNKTQDVAFQGLWKHNADTIEIRFFPSTTKKLNKKTSPSSNLFFGTFIFLTAPSVYLPFLSDVNIDHIHSLVSTVFFRIRSKSPLPSNGKTAHTLQETNISHLGKRKTIALGKGYVSSLESINYRLYKLYVVLVFFAVIDVLAMIVTFIIDTVIIVAFCEINNHPYHASS